LEDVFLGIKEPPSFWTSDGISVMIVGFVVGMKYLHSVNIVHGSLNPSNLLLDNKYRIHVSDFLGNVHEECGAKQGAVNFFYVAPETVRGEPVTKKTDVFAFGLILHELVVGRSVFPKEESPFQLVARQLKGERPEIPGFVLPQVAKLIKTCWSKSPESRPTFDEICSLLQGRAFSFFDDVSAKVIKSYIDDVNNPEAA
jgi:serine/threonine protein kinase